jgi:magnesium transporter
MAETREELENQDLETFRNLIKEKKYSVLRGKAQDMNESDLAYIMDNMEDEDMLTMFRLFPKGLAADVFSQLSMESQQYIITSLSEKEAGSIIDNLFADDATDLLEEMPANVVKKILSNAKPETRQDINHLLQYADDSAGSVMTTEFMDLKENMTVNEALERIRTKGFDSETVNTCYVLNPKRLLMGTVSLRKLILHKPDEVIGDFMHENVISCNTTMDEEKVVQLFKKYDLTALPVVDNEHRMVGIITVDDVMDIMEKETTEDIDKMAAIIPGDNKPYLKTSIFDTFKKRIPWLMLLMVSATFTGKIITSFENALSKYVVLSAYIPMLMDTGGNSGGQTSAEVVRSLSLEQVSFSDFFKVIWKELRVALMAGVSLAIVAFLKCILLDGVSVTIGIVIGITIIFVVLCSKLTAAVLTLVVDKVGLDPAVVASPVLTTIIDAIALLVYFTIATNLLGL